GFTRFEAKDVVRHPLVQRIVEAYDSFDDGSGAKR
ncbi:MAG: PhoH family protein, partial [Gammaproteobacteria bacterium]